MDASEAVTAFVSAVERVLRASEANVAELVRAVNAGSASASGTLAGGTRYTKHGSGVRFVEADGTTLDLDADLGGTERLIFDAWRVSEFLRSRGKSERNDDEITTALAAAATQGVVQKLDHRPGWYTLAGPVRARAS